MRRLCLAILITASLATASDVGLIRPSDPGCTASIVYESFKRDVKQTIADYNGGGWFDGEQEEDHIFLRLNMNRTPSLGFVLDLGAADADNSEGYVPLVGLGTHYIAYTSDAIVAALFGQIHYIGEIEYQGTYDPYVYSFRGAPTRGHAIKNRTESYFEYEAGIQLSKDFNAFKDTRCSVYGGFMLSYLHSKGEERDKLYVSADPDAALIDTFSTDGLNFKADVPFAIYAGLELASPSEKYGARAEARFLDQSSFSLSAFRRF